MLRINHNLGSGLVSHKIHLFILALLTFFDKIFDFCFINH